MHCGARQSDRPSRLDDIYGYDVFVTFDDLSTDVVSYRPSGVTVTRIPPAITVIAE